MTIGTANSPSNGRYVCFSKIKNNQLFACAQHNTQKLTRKSNPKNPFFSPNKTNRFYYKLPNTKATVFLVFGIVLGIINWVAFLICWVSGCFWAFSQKTMALDFNDAIGSIQVQQVGVLSGAVKRTTTIPYGKIVSCSTVPSNTIIGGQKGQIVVLNLDDGTTVEVAPAEPESVALTRSGLITQHLNAAKAAMNGGNNGNPAVVQVNVVQPQYAQQPQPQYVQQPQYAPQPVMYADPNAPPQPQPMYAEPPMMMQQQQQQQQPQAPMYVDPNTQQPAYNVPPTN